MAETPMIQFLGAAGTVTGSRHLVRAGGRVVLLDCGLFQGPKPLRQRNRDRFPFDPRRLDAVVLSHAHLDHSGGLPLLAKAGFRGAVFCTPGTADLLGPLLRDAAHLQEEEAAHANRHGYSKHRPALPLYTAADAEAVFPLLRRQPYGEPFPAAPGFAATLRRAGHILGSASVELRITAHDPVTLAFSGDLGRRGHPILRGADPVPEADVVLIESTYGDRTHPPDPSGELARVLREAVERGGAVLVPAFAVGRTQELIWMLRKLEDAGAVPPVPVFIDSPMGIDVTDIFCRHPEDHTLDMAELMDAGRCPLCCRQYHLTRTPAESKALNDRAGPMVVVAGSGMVTGGRILHHLQRRLSDPRTTVLLVGYQAEGTRGRALQHGAEAVTIFGERVPVRAKVETVHGLSGHAGRDDLLAWLGALSRPPRWVYAVHGEPGPARALADAVRARLGWDARVAADGETVSLS
ncbi:MAG: MBL fold metallo-hydrolase [Gemmataceae bacterium]|nr:MBL fold metallo-hydrolase [Gemmataceae bacterium]